MYMCTCIWTCVSVTENVSDCKLKGMSVKIFFNIFFFDIFVYTFFRFISMSLTASHVTVHVTPHHSTTTTATTTTMESGEAPFNRRAASTQLWWVESCSLPSRWPIPIPAVPFYVVKNTTSPWSTDCEGNIFCQTLMQLLQAAYIFFEKKKEKKKHNFQENKKWENEKNKNWKTWKNMSILFRFVRFITSLIRSYSKMWPEVIKFPYMLFFDTCHFRSLYYFCLVIK